ncbi:MAG: aminotransferase class V-fold PLP-dependent enzyme [Firmicutes bacterium]|nr:aminotransferase class V-fold PLP-dependent enzyme [Bacillota bacterium]MBQ6261043.1 aminotransferase class V-fold PLP-dependent enzyme [Bacillota bacterium]
MNAIDAIRRDVPVTSKCLYFDASYDNGGTLFGRQAMQEYFDDWEHAALNMERGGPGRKTFFDKADICREKLAKLLGGVDPKGICFTRNTNEGLNHIMQGYRFEPGDNIVSCDIEHASVLWPCLNAKRLRGVEVRVAHAVDGLYMTPQVLMDACDEHTKMIAVSHVQSLNGYKLDLETVGQFCKERGIFLLVDAIQSLGIIPMKAVDWNVAAITCGGYKGMLSVESTAFTWMRSDLMKNVEPLYVGATRTLKVDKEKWELSVAEPENAKKFENSSLDNPGIYTLLAGVTRLEEVGVENIWPHVCRLYEKLYDGLSAMGFTMVCPRNEKEHGATIAIKFRDQQAAAEYFKSNGVVFSNSSYLKFSVGSYCSEEDVDKLLDIASRCPAEYK